MQVKEKYVCFVIIFSGVWDIVGVLKGLESINYLITNVRCALVYLDRTLIPATFQNPANF